MAGRMQGGAANGCQLATAGLAQVEVQAWMQARVMAAVARLAMHLPCKKGGVLNMWHWPGRPSDQPLVRLDAQSLPVQGYAVVACEAWNE